MMYIFKNDEIGGGGRILEKSLVKFIPRGVLCSMVRMGSLLLV